MAKVEGNILLQSDAPRALSEHRPEAASAPFHIVVATADSQLRGLLGRRLRADGYEVTGLQHVGELSEVFASCGGRSIDLTVLDVGPPHGGSALLSRIPRLRADAPVILIGTAEKEVDLIAGLDAGADDYLVKPLAIPALLARLRAVMRRTSGSKSPARSSGPERFDFAGWRYFVRRRALYAPTGEEVALTAAEHELLLTLLYHPHRTIGRERLLDLARNRIAASSDRSIDVLVSRLRSKMGGVRRRNSVIRTVRGVGYMFAADLEIS